MDSGRRACYTEGNKEVPSMKKRFWILFLALCLLLPFGPGASANAPVPDPDRMSVTCRGVDEGTVIAVLVSGENGVFREALRETCTDAESFSFSFYREEGDTQFCLKLIAADGTELCSDAVALSESGRYRYDADANELKGSSFSDSCSGTAAALVMLLFVFALLAALGVTIVIELLTGLCFRLRPIRYVVLINLITNPVMNILLFILSVTLDFGRAYWIALIALELIVCGLEFWFYTRKYRTRKPWVLLLFTLTANALSAAAGMLPWLLLFG